MKAQRRRFVVEVKRGTSRASFVSTDAAADKFSSAEDALFGAKTKPAIVEATAHFRDAHILAKVSRGLGTPMTGIGMDDLELRLADRGW